MIETKKKKRGKGLLIIAIILIMIAGIGFLSYKMLKIATIDVKGNSIVGKEEIISLSEIQIGESLLSISNSKVEENIEKNPYVIFDGLDRVFPDTIIIKVKERVPKAYVEYMGSYVQINGEGYVLSIKDTITGDTLAIIKGIEVKTTTVGSVIEVDNMYQLDQLKEIIATLEKEKVYDIITEINMKDPNAIILSTNDGYTVKLGEFSYIPNKINMFAVMRDKLINEMGITVGGTIDVTTVTSDANKGKGYYSPPTTQ